MKAMGRYEVVGSRRYRGHEPGMVFEATLDPHAETRAINRGSIRLIERLEADLPPNRYRLPAGWPVKRNTERV